MTHRRVVGRTALVSLGLVLLGCAANPVPPVPPDSPFYGSSLSSYDASLRHYITMGDSTALPMLREGGPKDELVRELNAGLFLRRLGRYEESNIALQRADRLAEERYTKSISQNIAAFLVSDNALDYYPSAVEWSMIHYYGMMNYLQLGDVENALVSARRANALVRRYANDNPGRSFTNPAALQYFAGMLQWGAGEENDAMVSLRNAAAAYAEYEALYGVEPPAPVLEDVVDVATALGFDDVAERTRVAYHLDEPTAPSPGTGELLVVIENGFIAHRAEQKLYIPVLAEEKDSVIHGDVESALRAAFRVLIRTIVVMNVVSQEGGEFPRHEDGVIIATAGSAVGLELITMAWPAYRLDARRASNIRVSVDEGHAITPTLIQDLSAISVRDFEEQKPTIMVRMVARGLIKEAAVTAGEEAGEKAGGDVGGFLARIGLRAAVTATERADTRSWSTLPAELQLARFRLPAGRHRLRISYDGWNGRRGVEEFDVTIEAGRVAIHTVALLGDDVGNRERLQIAKQGVHYRAPSLRESGR